VSDPILKELALERYARLIRGATGQACAMAYCAPGEEIAWIGESAHLPQAEEGLRELSDFESASTDPQRLALDGGALVLHAPVRAGGPSRVGQLAILLEAELPEDRLNAIGTMLSDLIACIERDYRLNREANELAEELSNRYEELNLLYAMGGHIRAFEQGAEGARALLCNLAERLEVDFAGFVIGRDLDPIHADNLPTHIPNQDLVLTAIRGDLFRFACTARAPIVLNHLDDPRRQYLLANMTYRALACPVVDCGTSNAMLVLLRSQDRPEFTNGDRSLAMVIANQTAIMMQNHAMLGSLQKFGVQMAGALIEAIEAKDPYTRGHSERVQSICVKLGKAVGLSADSIEDISWGALLHDVGKIGVPDHIICKAGSLTTDEYTMIKIHPERSYEILRHIEDLSRGALEAARYHHERFDGAGYPHGLRGKQIPVESRVISVGDTYDALTSSRSYRSALSHDAALQIIRDVAGTQLDADLVQAFENLCKRESQSLLRGTGAEDDANG
jgi:HD-GYP domain-containing protein (c-di-GMP phosphodiesterase class II)